MYKGKLWLHQAVLFGMLGLLIIWSVVNGSFVFNLGLLWWLLGAMIGFLFVFFDRFLFTLVSNPSSILSIKLKEIFSKNNYADEVKLLLAEKYNQRELIMRSFLFVLVYMVLAFFTMTSVVNYFARGLMLGIGTHLIFDLIYDYIYDKERLDGWFWHIKRTLEPEEKRWFVIIVSAVYVLIAFNL